MRKARWNSDAEEGRGKWEGLMEWKTGSGCEMVMVNVENENELWVDEVEVVERRGAVRW